MIVKNDDSYRKRHRALQRYTGTLVLIGVMLGALGLILSLALGIYPQRHDGFDVVPRLPYKHSFDPIVLVEHGVLANTVPSNVDQLAAVATAPVVRAISIFPDRVNLLAAGITIRTFITPVPITNMAGLKALIDDPAWIEEPVSGRLVLKTALVTQAGSKFTIGAPYVSDLTLLNVPSVFVGTRGGTLTFDRVHVHSSVPDSAPRGPYRPFVLATGDATMTLLDSEMSDLGWDWNASYGVSWEQGSTGSAINTTFERNFIGVYTGRSDGLTFRDCVFRNNDLYGLDPHTYSRHLTVDNVLAENNRAHGIIFSDYVRDSVIKNSVSRNNGENGIMMDKHSTGNQIFNNVITGNKGDGLVTASSPDNGLADNDVSGNRVGIRLSPADTKSTTVTGNRIQGNDTAIENVDLAHGNSVIGNGGQWNWPVIRRIWLPLAGVLGLCAVLLAIHMARDHRSAPTRLTTVPA